MTISVFDVPKQEGDFCVRVKVEVRKYGAAVGVVYDYLALRLSSQLGVNGFCPCMMVDNHRPF